MIALFCLLFFIPSLFLHLLIYFYLNPQILLLLKAVPSHSDPAFCGISLQHFRELCQGSLTGILCGGFCQPARVLVHNVLTCSQSHGVFGKRP